MEILENEKNLTIIKNETYGNKVYYLFSYNCEIAFFNETAQRLAISQEFWDYSQTTLKHLKHFINNYTAFKYETKQQFKALIEEKSKNDSFHFILF